MIQDGKTDSEGKITVYVDIDIKGLIPGFLENRQQDIESIMASLKRGDYETVKILGHSMKGAGGGYGFDAISDIGQSLELAAKERDASVIKKMVEELDLYMKRVEIVFKGQ